MLTNDVEAVSEIRCKGKGNNDCFLNEEGNIGYCQKQFDPRAKGKKCEATPPSPSPDKPEAQSSKTDSPVKNTEPGTVNATISKSNETNDNQSGTPGAVDSTVSKSNETGNATTSGVAEKNDAFIYATFFTLIILSNIFN